MHFAFFSSFKFYDKVYRENRMLKLTVDRKYDYRTIVPSNRRTRNLFFFKRYAPSERKHISYRTDPIIEGNQSNFDSYFPIPPSLRKIPFRNTLTKYYCQRSLIVLNPSMPVGFFHHNSLDRSISNRRGVWLVFIIIKFYRNS